MLNVFYVLLKHKTVFKHASNGKT